MEEINMSAIFYVSYISLWGLLLGCGILTPILSSAFLVVLATQLTAGVALGAASGAVFGASRETLALVPLIWLSNKGQPADLVKVLPVSAITVGSLNIVWLLGGGLLLMLLR
jgi:hypothetical protein